MFACVTVSFSELNSGWISMRTRTRGEARQATEPVETRRDASRVFSLYEELRTQLAGVAGSRRSGEVDDFGLDHDALSRAQRLLDFLFDRYWRVVRHQTSEGQGKVREDIVSFYDAKSAAAFNESS